MEYCKMSNLNNEHLEMICKLQYKDLKLANMGRSEMLLAMKLIEVGIAQERDLDKEETLRVRYLHLTEKGQMILEQLELELNKAVMA
jgi:hypothetical protein